VNYTVIDCAQRSDAWRTARLGRLTGSRAAMMKATTRSGDEAAARRNLRTGLGLERVTKNPADRAFTTRVVTHGVDFEPMALGIHEARSGYVLTQPGFLSCGPVMVGCSLDGAVYKDGRIEGIVEAKCPESATHYRYLLTREIPDDYRWQCIHNMWVSGAQWCDFISFDPDFPEDIQYLCVRMKRDEKEITAYAAEAKRFLVEVSIEVEDIQKLLNRVRKIA
jgi:YqaJ-like viral recombinase domain